MLWFIGYLLIAGLSFGYFVFTNLEQLQKKGQKMTEEHLLIITAMSLFWPIGWGIVIGIILWAYAAVKAKENEK